MHDIEPFYGWHDDYRAEDDKRSPFFGNEYSEFECSFSIYNHYIHPQWDYFGSSTLFAKLLFTDYDEGYAIIELLGEWNDCLYNDIMYLKRNLIEPLLQNDINRFVLIGENVLNFHYSDTDYYEEWWDELDNGWIAGLSLRPHVYSEICKGGIDRFIAVGNDLNINWRTFRPEQLFLIVNKVIDKRWQNLLT